MNRDLVIPLSDPRASLENVGGKGASLARLCRAGLPVPGGFHVTTAAYKAFIAENVLQPFILQTASTVDVAQPAALEAASQAIRDRFLQSHMPDAVSIAITQAYQTLPSEPGAFAVRSSATAEDLPDASFAGQQETYLNVRGVETLLNAVKKCWASLWTARAIAYRAKNQIDHSAIALAVVVQELVFADAAGVMFTANPTNGRRDEILINAAWGLGEVLVSGAVTPDTVIISRSTGKILRRDTAEKQVMTVRAESGIQEAAVPSDLKNKPSINNAQAAALARMGEKIERLYDAPMDVEWALAGGKFAILQARPITSLPPDWTRPNNKAIYARGSLAEHLPNPVTPLFATLGLSAVNQATAELAKSLNFDALEAEYQYRAVNGYVFMGFLSNPVMLINMVKASGSALRKIFSNTREHWLEAMVPLDAVLARWEPVELTALPAAEILAGVDEVFTQVGRLYTVLQTTTLPAATSSEMILSRIYRLVRRRGDPEPTALLYGFDTMPVRTEKALFDLAMWVKDLMDQTDSPDPLDPVQRKSLAETIRGLTSKELAAALKKDRPPQGVSAGIWEEWKLRFESFLHSYGATIYDLDFANPTPSETPEPALDAIKMYLNDQGQNPSERQRAAAELRERTTQALLARLKWPVKGWFTKTLMWAQDNAPVREDSLESLGKAHPLVRRMLGELGRRFEAANAIETADDIYWLEDKEAASFCSQLEQGELLPDMRGVVTARKTAWQAQLKLTPPAVLPEKSWWGKIMPWNKTDQPGNTLKGSGASAGRVTAPACVLLSPNDFSKMKPGFVLVAVTTTPAWTPLFAMASAVVTDIGGPLSHSSIVAREYGIPAVMAAGLATRRIHDGQIITVDGSAGLVILEPAGSGNGSQKK